MSLPVNMELTRASAVQLVHLSREYRRADGARLPVIDDLTFEVPAGEILAVVGASGSGKTTLLNLIAGLDRPTSGRVLIDGVALTRLNERAVMVFQTDAVFPFLRVAANVGYGVQDETRRETLVAEYLRLVGLEESASSWPRELSVGMRKRVEVARAYARETGLLLMDEPFGALDVLTKESMQELLLALWARARRTIVFVTHDVEEAAFLAHRVLVLAPSYPMIDIPFAYPRAAELKLTPTFLELRRMITRHLSNRMIAATPAVGDSVAAAV